MLAIAILVTLLKPHLINDLVVVKRPMSRKKIALAGVSTLLVWTMAFSAILAVAEPTSVKAERVAREAAEAKILQQQKDDAEKRANEAAEQAKLNKPVVKTETKVEAVPFDSTEQNDNSIPAGEKRISVAGANGERTITYKVTYVRNQETIRAEIKNEVTKAPITQVTLNGTYVAPATQQSSCPNGSYVNTAGNKVCSPYQSSGAPTGASAQCADGTYSFSQSRRGTCSHHGGVANWL